MAVLGKQMHGFVQYKPYTEVKSSAASTTYPISSHKINTMVLLL
jgi:hypothetical protein